MQQLLLFTPVRVLPALHVVVVVVVCGTGAYYVWGRGGVGGVSPTMAWGTRDEAGLIRKEVKGGSQARLSEICPVGMYGGDAMWLCGVKDCVRNSIEGKRSLGLCFTSGYF